MNSYEKQKRVGNIGEDRFEEMMHRAGRKIIFTSPKDVNLPGFDFIVESKQGSKEPAVLIEVKTETLNTQNIAIECQHKGNPSGIFTTKADYYVIYHTLTEQFFCMSTERIKEHIQGLTPMPCAGGKTMCYLLPKTSFQLLA